MKTCMNIILHFKIFFIIIIDHKVFLSFTIYSKIPNYAFPTKEYRKNNFQVNVCIFF